MKQRLFLVMIIMTFALLKWDVASYAQSPRTIELGPCGGMSMTLNDINPLNFFNEPGYAYGGLVRYNHDTRWAFRLDYSHSMVRSSDAIALWRPEREKSFKAIINDLSMVVEFNFLNFYTGRVGDAFSTYMFAGVSTFKYKTAPILSVQEQTALAGDAVPQNLEAFNRAWQSLETDRSFSIPFGFGFKFSLSEHLATSIEWKMNYTLTDRLDGLNPTYEDADSHYFAVVTKTEKKAKDGNVVMDQNGNPLYTYEINVNQGGTPTNGYDLTDQTGLFGKYQQMSNSATNDWFGSITLSLTWKIPLPGGNACRVNNY